MDPIAFFNIPAYGHIGPSLPIVEQLIERGARVLYFVDETYADVVAKTGAEVRVVPHMMSCPHGYTPSSMVQFAALMAEQSYNSLPLLQEQVKEAGVSLVSHDYMCPWGRFVARTMGLRSVRTISILAAFDPVMPKMKMPPSILLKQLRNLPDIFRFRKTARALRDTYGLEDLGLADVLRNRGDLNLLFTSPEFLPHSERLDDSYRFVGAMISSKGESENHPLLQELDDRPLIYVSLGTVFNERGNLYDACIKAFAPMDVSVVMAVGKKFDPASLEPLPENVRAVSHAPQLEILKRASLFISQAGGCSVNESLTHGVPLVMWPQTPEHRFNADCVVAQNAGVLLDVKDITEERLRGIAQKVLNDKQMKARAEAVGESLQKTGGAARAAEDILAFQASAG